VPVSPASVTSRVVSSRNSAKQAGIGPHIPVTYEMSKSSNVDSLQVVGGNVPLNALPRKNTLDSTGRSDKSGKVPEKVFCPIWIWRKLCKRRRLSGSVEYIELLASLKCLRRGNESKTSGSVPSSNKFSSSMTVTKPSSSHVRPSKAQGSSFPLRNQSYPSTVETASIPVEL
jgi:hypothetical protein